MKECKNNSCVSWRSNIDNKCDRFESVEVCTFSIHDNEYVAHPSHYTGVVPNIECIQVTQHFNFNRGNAIKYIWRAGEKDKSKEIEDLQKAIQYLEFEIQRLSHV